MLTNLWPWIKEQKISRKEKRMRWAEGNARTLVETCGYYGRNGEVWWLCGEVWWSKPCNLNYNNCLQIYDKKRILNEKSNLAPCSFLQKKEGNGIRTDFLIGKILFSNMYLADHLGSVQLTIAHFTQKSDLRLAPCSRRLRLSPCVLCSSKNPHTTRRVSSK